MMMMVEVHTSKREPSRTALRMPSGIEIKKLSSIIQRPSDMETQIIPHHDEETFIGGLVEPELLLQALDEFGIEPSRAAVFRVDGIRAGAALHLPARAEVPAGRAGNARRRAGVGAADLGDHLLD